MNEADHQPHQKENSSPKDDLEIGGNVSDSIVVQGHGNVLHVGDSKLPVDEEKLKQLESQAVRFELKGELHNARRTWYEIRRIDPMYPRVDFKIKHLEYELRPKAVNTSSPSPRLWGSSTAMFLAICLLVFVPLTVFSGRMAALISPRQNDMTHAMVVVTQKPYTATVINSLSSTYTPRPTFTQSDIPDLVEVSVTSEETSNGVLLHIKSINSEYALGPFPAGSYILSPSNKFIVYVAADADGSVYISKIGTVSIDRLGRLKQDDQFVVFSRNESPSYRLTLSDVLLVIHEEKFDQSTSYVIPFEYSE